MFTFKWDIRFLRLAKHISTWSKDPSTQTGCIIVRPNKTIASVGFNGLPRKMDDLEEYLNIREKKIKRIVHCEMNAILSAKESLQGYTLYNFPGQSCTQCAIHVIQAGITGVVSPNVDKEFAKRWNKDWKANEAEELYKECGVRIKYYDI